MPPEMFFNSPFLVGGGTSTRRKFFLAANFALARLIETRCGNHFEKQFRHFLGGRAVHGAVHSNHSAEC